MEKYPYISSIPDRKSVFARMRSAKASFPAELERDIDEYIKYAQSVFSASGIALEFEITGRDEESVEFGGVRVESKLLSSLLSGSAKVYLMGASIAHDKVEMINAAIKGGQGLKALVMDAFASECVDGALDVIMERKNASLKRTGQKLTHRRFSAGYGDLDIRFQKPFYDLLDMRKINVEINERFLLSPEKSVIAVAGVE